MRGQLHAAFVAVLGMAALLAWLLLFAAGLSIDSQPYRDQIAAPPSAGDGADAPRGPRLSALVLVTALYTPLNAALLTILAALIGGCTSYLTFSRDPTGTTALEVARSAPTLVFLTEVPFASMLRGFLVYVAAIAGIYITTENPFDATTPAQYVRVVGLLSFVGFVIGYDPTGVERVIAKLPGVSGPADSAGAPADPVPSDSPGAPADPAPSSSPGAPTDPASSDSPGASTDPAPVGRAEAPTDRPPSA